MRIRMNLLSSRTGSETSPKRSWHIPHLGYMLEDFVTRLWSNLKKPASPAWRARFHKRLRREQIRLLGWEALLEESWEFYRKENQETARRIKDRILSWGTYLLTSWEAISKSERERNREEWSLLLKLRDGVHRRSAEMTKSLLEGFRARRKLQLAVLAILSVVLGVTLYPLLPSIELPSLPRIDVEVPRPAAAQLTTALLIAAGLLVTLVLGFLVYKGSLLLIKKRVFAGAYTHLESASDRSLEAMKSWFLQAQTWWQSRKATPTVATAAAAAAPRAAKTSGKKRPARRPAPKKKPARPATVQPATASGSSSEPQVKKVVAEEETENWTSSMVAMSGWALALTVIIFVTAGALWPDQEKPPAEPQAAAAETTPATPPMPAVPATASPAPTEEVIFVPASATPKIVTATKEKWTSKYQFPGGHTLSVNGLRSDSRYKMKTQSRELTFTPEKSDQLEEGEVITEASFMALGDKPENIRLTLYR